MSWQGLKLPFSKEAPQDSIDFVIFLFSLTVKGTVILALVISLTGFVAFSPTSPAIASENGEEANESTNGVVITPLQFNDDKYSSAQPMDWSSDGKTILIQYGVYDETTLHTRHALALTDPDLSKVVELTFPQSFPMGEPTPDNVMVFIDDPVSVAYFSPDFSMDENENEEDWDVFFLWKRELYAYHIASAQLEKLLDGATYFDVTTSPQRLIYNNDVGEGNGRLSVFNTDTKQSEVILEKAAGLYAFDLSPDDSRILYIDYGKSRSDSAYLIYYDLATGERNIIPNVGFGPVLPQWTAGGSDYMIIESSGWYIERGGWLGASIHVASLDGKTDTVLMAKSIDNPKTFITSPDGKSILVKLSGQTVNGTLTSIGRGDMYRLDYATVIPEFGSIVALLMVVGIVGSVAAARSLQQYNRNS